MSSTMKRSRVTNNMKRMGMTMRRRKKMIKMITSTKKKIRWRLSSISTSLNVHR